MVECMVVGWKRRVKVVVRVRRRMVKGNDDGGKKKNDDIRMEMKMVTVEEQQHKLHNRESESGCFCTASSPMMEVLSVISPDLASNNNKKYF